MWFERTVGAGMLLTAVAAFVAEALAAANARVDLAPKFVRGETLVYQVEIGTATAGQTTAPITDDEGATQSSLKVSLRERLEILSIVPSTTGDIVGARLTWDEADATSSSDALDPIAGDPAAPFRQLEGQSVEFTLSADGALGKFNGMEKVILGGVPPAESVEWLASLVAANRFPRDGVNVGQEWESEAPIAGAPIAGLFWSTKSTYQRNEPCSSQSELSAPGGTKHQCAVILNVLNIARRAASSRGGATPDDYLRNGLRTSGTWTGTGEELGTIDLSTGVLCSETENSSQAMDYTIRSEASGSTIHYVAKVQTQMGITLIEDARPAKRGDH